jgi:hypothetical protein
MDMSQGKVLPSSLSKAVSGTEYSIVDQNWQSYCRARDNGHKNYVRDAKLFDKYYIGEQWDDEVLAELKGQKRPAMTINLVLSTINAMIGEYIGTRQDIDVKPVSVDANEETASALDKIIGHILHDSKSKYLEKQVVLDGLVQERGYFDIRMNYEENIFGEAREDALDPIDVIPDSGARDYDPRKWNEVHITRWMTPDEIEEQYGPEKGSRVRFVDAANSYGTDSVDLDPSTFAQKSAFYTQGPDNYNYQDDWRQVKRVRVVERQYWKLTQRPYFVDVETGDASPVPDDWKPERIQGVIDYLAQKGVTMQVIKRIQRRVRWTVTCDKYLLHDDWSPYNHFTIVPFFPYFRRGRPFGPVRNLISPQDILNKSASQELHVINTTANSGWKVEAGSLANMSVADLANVGAKTGLVLEFKRGFTPPEKILPNQIPTGLDRVSSKTVMYFREISGVSTAMLGMPGQEISGAALANKQQRGLTQMNVVFDNLALTRQIRGEILLGLIQQFYTDTRLFRIIGKGPEGEQTEEQVVLNQPDPVTGDILNDVTLGEYGIVISSKPSKDSEADSDVEQLLRAREAGIMVPDWAVMEASNISNRKEIAQWMRQMQGAAEPTEQEVQMAQMQAELAIQQQVATIDELRAKTQERMANAAKLMAEAQTLPMEMQVEMQKFGAQMRLDLEKSAAELQKNREDLMARLAIMREKTNSEKYQANLQALTKRLETQAKERIASMRGTARVASAKKRS